MSAYMVGPPRLKSPVSLVKVLLCAVQRSSIPHFTFGLSRSLSFVLSWFFLLPGSCGLVVLFAVVNAELRRN